MTRDLCINNRASEQARFNHKVSRVNAKVTESVYYKLFLGDLCVFPLLTLRLMNLPVANNHRLIHIVLMILLILSSISCRQERPADYVDPFICTHADHGQWLPAALVPFGLVELCPDTWPGSLTADGDFAHSGYDWSDNHIRGFSHLHRGSSGGTSVHDRAGLISVIPYTGMPVDTFFINPVVPIDKKTEKASAGYYSVFLPRDKILAEFSATTRTGIHRFTPDSGGNVSLFLYEGNRSGEKLTEPGTKYSLPLKWKEKTGTIRKYFTLLSIIPAFCP